jgi:hypothetical protein
VRQRLAGHGGRVLARFRIGPGPYKAAVTTIDSSERRVAYTVQGASDGSSTPTSLYVIDAASRHPHPRLVRRAWSTEMIGRTLSAPSVLGSSVFYAYIQHNEFGSRYERAPATGALVVLAGAPDPLTAAATVLSGHWLTEQTPSLLSPNAASMCDPPTPLEAPGGCTIRLGPAAG